MLYVVAIRQNQSGGSESLHQLAAEVKKNGMSVAMYYSDCNSLEVPDKFKKYDLTVANEIKDSDGNVIVVAETETQILFDYKKIRKCIWWLSRDFYYGYANLEGLIRSAQRHGIKRTLYPIYVPIVFIKKKLTPKYFRFQKKDSGIFHLYNCEYARLYLKENGIEKDQTLYMCGPIRNEYFDTPFIDKENIVAYNPKKNFEYTIKVIALLQQKRPDIQVVAIEGMKPQEIVNLLNRCKVYIDFGQFPGPERIPREAVTCRCNILTSRYGSTRNSIDVPIPDQFKIDASSKNITKIVNMISELTDKYEHYVSKYDIYRKKVANQRVLLAENTKIFIDHFLDSI